MAKVQKSNREARKPKADPKLKKKADGSVEGAFAAGKANWGKATKK